MEDGEGLSGMNPDLPAALCAVPLPAPSPHSLAVLLLQFHVPVGEVEEVFPVLALAGVEHQ